MRLSANRGSVFYDEAKLALHPQVFIDGIAVSHCVEASEEEGWADQLVKDEAGKFVLNETQDGVKVKRLTGRVEIHYFALHQ